MDFLNQINKYNWSFKKNNNQQKLSFIFIWWKFSRIVISWDSKVNSWNFLNDFKKLLISNFEVWWLIKKKWKIW